MTTFLNQVLPAVALSLWCAIYVVYGWRDPGVRRWLERQAFQISHRPQRRPSFAPLPRPATFYAPPPPPTARRPSPSVVAPRLSGSAAIAAVRVAEWEAANLPMRYRLLGQVRPASNDN